ncbi:MAG: hypothetical protein JHC87_01045, partial [Thermoleophilaceae bacterium]|nr:hypothetical protein [Thermoleophilaceae bacterium]
NTPTFTITGTEVGSTFECRFDGAGAWVVVTSPYTSATLTDGEHTLACRATDPAGNTDQTPATRTFTVDTTTPDTAIPTGPTGTTNDNTPTFTITSTKPNSTFECNLDGTGWLAATTPYTLGVIADGTHTLECRATDSVGNTDPTPASRTFTVDTTAPDTAIPTGPSGTTNDNTPTFTITGTEVGSTFECRLDGSAWVTVTSPLTTAALPDGAHTLECRATDPAGNTDQTPASRTFTVDTTPPDTAIPTGPTDPTTDNTPTITITGTEPGSTFECRIDGGAWVVVTSPYTTGVLPDGAHTIECRATDPAGNTDPTPAVVKFTVATGGPIVTEQVTPGVIVGLKANKCVRGKVSVKPTFSGPSGANLATPKSMIVYVDGKRVATVAASGGTVSYKLNTAKLANKTHTVKIKVTFSNGKTAVGSGRIKACGNRITAQVKNPNFTG